MHSETVETVIIGGGLSGIYAAHLLAMKQKEFVVLEAREKIGGRIVSPEHRGFFADLGPSWYWPEIHPTIAGLVRTFGLGGYPQFESGRGRFQRSDGSVLTVGSYATEPQSWRLTGGMRVLTDTLSAAIASERIHCGHPVCRIERQPRGVQVVVGELEMTPKAMFRADNVILALPPRLAAATILFEPDLPDHLAQAMLKTGTWMAGQAKFFALYNEPFWRSYGLSGQAFSERGPAGEIHDGSNNGCGPYGLTGFLGVPAVYRNQHPDLSGTLPAQLAAIFGEPAAHPEVFFYRDWARERYTATEYDQPPMVTHPVYGPPDGRTAIWENTLHFAGTETAERHGGYLEGALVAAERAVATL